MASLFFAVRAESELGARILPPPAAVPLPLAREAGDGRGRVLENGPSAVPEGAYDGRGCGIGKPPLRKGGGPRSGGGIRPPAQPGVSTWGVILSPRRSWGDSSAQPSVSTFLFLFSFRYDTINQTVKFANGRRSRF